MSLGYIAVSLFAPLWLYELYLQDVALGRPFDLMWNFLLCFLFGLAYGLLAYPRSIAVRRTALAMFVLHLIHNIFWRVYGENISNTSVWDGQIALNVIVTLLALHSNFEDGDFPWRMNLRAYKAMGKESYAMVSLAALFVLAGVVMLCAPSWTYEFLWTDEMTPYKDAAHYTLRLLADALIGFGIGGLSDPIAKPTKRMYLFATTIALFAPGAARLAGRYDSVNKGMNWIDEIIGIAIWVLLVSLNMDVVEALDLDLGSDRKRENDPYQEIPDKP
eukprot:CAMPEP_0170167732 /NCGR_PEP_ID=MMETSP0040_2-20121228/1050_1 /TAXON_ID=641309 /ORGANISM="Lotharella oceanica, Strain CCMP622" /LENGTH=274 /DNA_ID=CAMNT_0010405845 /DNA_START=154 /DNA_END=978 /DNA_ORIENTATION=+